MKLPSSWKTSHLGLLLILAAFIVASFASILFLSRTLLTLNRLLSESGQSSHTVQVVQDLLISLDDAETGARGYAVTGDPKYLEPYEAARRSQPTILKELARIPSDQVPRARTAQMRQQTEKRMKLLQDLIDAKSANSNELVQTTVNSGQGKQTMDALRLEIGQISAAGQQSVDPRQRQAHAHLRRAITVGVIQIVFLMGICAVLVWYFRRSIRRERALENTKSEFLSLASHQLRTPATNVKQYVGLLLDGYIGHITAKQRKALEVAYKNNELEIKIVNDLLDVAKLDLKRIQLSRQSVNVASLVRSVAEYYQAAAEAKQQTLSIKAPKRLMASVDRNYFKGVIEKLIDNAIKYSRPETFITVRVTADEDRRMFQVTVRDRGVGMQKRDITKLFMKFSRLNNEFSAYSEGSGTGLYWVKQVVLLHGGRIKVATREGEGSKFTVRLPVD